MARIALIDPSGRAATTVRAVLGRSHEIAVRARVHAPGDVDLVIADLRYADLVDQSTLRGLVSFAPVLVLIDRREPVPPSIEESGNLSILKKPFDAFELRLKVEHLLRGALASAPGPTVSRAEDEDAGLLEFPYVPAPAGAVLRRAAKLSAPLWIMGEPGCGRRRIALAVCRSTSPALRAVTLFPDERLEAVIAREKDGGPFALIVPEVEDRPILEQERLAGILAGPRGFRLIATSVDDPADRVVAGTFSRNLYRHLVGLAVQVSPLRERPIAIPPLAQALARRIARSLGSQGELSFSPEAMARLQTYMWPGNLVELESVLTRTFASLAESELDGRTIEEHELLFTPEDAVRPRVAPRAPSSTRAPERPAEKFAETARSVGRIERGASPVGLRGTEAARRAEPEPGRRPEAARVPEPERARPDADRLRVEPERQRPELLRPREPVAGSDTRGAEQARETFETVVQSLAHELRNPLTTIKTLAGTLTTREGDVSASGGELVALAGEACERIEGSLEAMQQYATFGAPRKQPIDVVALLRQAIEGSDGAARVRMLVQGTIEVASDAEQLLFVFDNLIAAALAEAGHDGEVVVGSEPGPVIVIRVPAARGAVAKLHRLASAQRQPVSWRIVLARAVAARNGWDVEVEAAADAVAIRCRPPGGEVGARDQQQ